ncbi:MULTISPECIES: hypothetical protein [Leptolyngbya]|uniref:hypothetical protein n=1 Tax=Leptolyngbya TaxID=47251 RepID=UPI0016877431|nr:MULTISPECIES: hypothetical protein [Leptolyngbya]MBD2401000.1 hypothetical protein [Leptolyngbya sp. FACHB-239]
MNYKFAVGAIAPSISFTILLSTSVSAAGTERAASANISNESSVNLSQSRLGREN